ncbi:MAG: hypothetical protein ACTSR5_11465 [Promethearchaeota archaeon]
MTQKKAEAFSHELEDSGIKRSTRIGNAPPDLFDPNVPRLGRRESEPHSAEITYIHDVLTANFPEGRAIWDLHHYFLGKKGVLKGKEIDIQFDVSFFQSFSISYTLSSYNAGMYGERIPDMVVNILSKSTWSRDLSEHVDICNNLGVSVYVVFSPYKVASKVYDPPFLRVFVLQEDGSYKQKELKSITLNEGESINEKTIIAVSERLPFRLGLMHLKRKHEGDQPVYRLIFIDLSEPRILLTKAEIEKQEAEEKAKKAEIEKQEAEEKAKAKELEKVLKEYRERFGEIK